jgi:flagellar biosynthesis protein FlhG
VVSFSLFYLTTAMHDQAKALRGLMEHRDKSLTESLASFGARDSRMVIITGGKGGVGKSNVALNLSIALAQSQRSVLLMDVNLGIGSLELLAGLNSPWNLSHVIHGGMSLEQILIDGPAGIKILPGAGSLGEENHEPKVRDEVCKQLADLNRRFQFTILDLGTGLHWLLDRLAMPADHAIMVTTAEPPSLAEAYASIKSVSKSQIPHWDVLVNQAASAMEADHIFQRLSHTTRAFLQTDLGFAGWIPTDPNVPKAVKSR